ncbi:ammonium transporter [Oscillatoria salina]|uniref:ammonium transporter n=1 Tax=Oscillatoria salina TaxID=331517 RepID=UPI0013BD864E|nr:ammonium transporter [Oscillatoria salina]MBZ8180833.1 ammonium transporter [Oscillatoria salina IIICB1]NET90100.1 ammonium transporter [Kamptonema sp. SIO1D9]
MMSKTKLKQEKSHFPNRRVESQTKTRYLWDAPIFEPIRAIAGRFSFYWLACIPLTALIVVIWNAAAVAQGFDPPEDVAELKVVLDSIFLLVASVLVIFMNAGFGMLETGFCRQKNAVNILAKNLIVFAIATIAYWAIGFALMYGEGNTFMGLNGFFFSGDAAAYGDAEYPEAVPIAISFLFQVAFAATAATIVSGAVAERIKFDAFLIFSFLLVAISYPITGRWLWDGEWLSGIFGVGFIDFAGSTIVHSVGGWAALMGAAFLGPRLGKYSDGRINAIPGHNMSIATLGCLILWIGWFGFNPGSELAATANVPYIALTTNLAAAAGGVTSTITSWVKDGKPDLSMIINGILAGLVAITAGCASVGYFSAIIIGGIGGVLVVFSVSFFDSIHIDDPVGATSVHLVNGVWGTLAVGLFATEGGLLFGGGITQLLAQIIGILVIGGFTVLFSTIVWLALKATLGIRVSAEEEIHGLDIGEHGMEAYAGFVKESDVLTGGMGAGISGVSEMPHSSEVS